MTVYGHITARFQPFQVRVCTMRRCTTVGEKVLDVVQLIARTPAERTNSESLAVIRKASVFARYACALITHILATVNLHILKSSEARKNWSFRSMMGEM